MKVIDDKSKYTLNGLKPSPFDARDYKYSNVKSLATATATAYPRRFMNKIQPIVDQGKLGSCGGFGYTSNAESDAMSNGDFNILSPLFIYAKHKLDYNDGSEGVNLRDLLKSGVIHGICKESLYPYPTDETTINKAKVCIFPTISKEAIADGLTRKLGGYATIMAKEELFHAIFTEGGVLAGMVVTDSFMNPQNGVIGELCGRIHGLHAIDFYGYDLDEVVTYDYSQLFYGDKVTKSYTGVIYAKNSWGDKWGNKGLFKIPIDLFDVDMVADFKLRLFNELWSPLHVQSPTFNPNYHLEHQDKVIEMWLGSNIMTIDGVKTVMDTIPLIQNSRTLVPVRAIAEAFGADVGWNDKEKKITLTIDGGF